MRRKIAIVLILITAVSIISLYPVTQNKTILISASFDNTMLQIIRVENWKNWYPDLNEAYKLGNTKYHFTRDTLLKIDSFSIPGKKIIIKVFNAMTYQVTESNKLMDYQYAFRVFPSDSAGIMKINLLSKRPFFYSLLGDRNPGDKAVNGLKAFLEDPKSLYGFDIQKSKIRDSIIATSNTYKISSKYLFPTIQHIFSDLTDYIKENHLIQTDHPSISYIPQTGDSIKITVGIPVNKLGPPGKEINCLQLPARGNVLVAVYEGPFSERKKIYNAITKYIVNHTVASPAIPFERYLNDSIPLSDSSIIKIELNYPVY